MPNTRSLPDSSSAPTPGAGKALVEAKDLGRYFDVSPPLLNRLLERRGRIFVKAVDGITFTINRGETFSLVGESGCGKSTVGHLLVGLYRPTRGEIRFEGVRLRGENRRKHAAIQSRMQMIFQDPYASLNPRWRVSRIIGEPIDVNGAPAERNRLRETVGHLLTQVGLAPGDGDKYPHEFSGGQRQRISIARALAGKPEFIVCDEPTSAPGCLGPGPDPQPDERAAAPPGADLPVHQPRPGRGLPHLDLGGGHVPSAAWSSGATPETCSKAPGTPTRGCCSTRFPICP